MNGDQGRFDLFETMGFNPEDGLVYLDQHIARMQASAFALGFHFDRHALRNELQTATFRLDGRCRVRVLLSRGGAMCVEVRPFMPWPQAVIPVAAVARLASPQEDRLLHKVTDRSIYLDALRRGGTYEVLLVDDDGFLTEGTFTNIFLERGDKLVTPPLRRGMLPGILRQHLLDIGEAIEDDVRPADVSGNFFIGNSVRGLVAASLVAAKPRAH